MTYRFDPAEFMALRARLRRPPNAVPDTGIDLSRSRGVTGFELERQRQRAIMAAEAERKARLEQELNAREERQHIAEMQRLNPRVVPQGATKTLIADGYPPIHEIIGTVCALVDMSVAHLKSERRDQMVVGPRFVAMMLCKMLTLHSLPSIGRHFGGRDHTTVLHALRKMAEVEKRTLAEIPAEATLCDYATVALRCYEAQFPGRCYRITEAIRRLDEGQAA